jgi:hypothetical protein
LASFKPTIYQGRRELLATEIAVDSGGQSEGQDVEISRDFVMKQREQEADEGADDEGERIR